MKCIFLTEFDDNPCKADGNTHEDGWQNQHVYIKFTGLCRVGQKQKGEELGKKMYPNNIPKENPYVSGPFEFLLCEFV